MTQSFFLMNLYLLITKSKIIKWGILQSSSCLGKEILFKKQQQEIGCVKTFGKVSKISSQTRYWGEGEEAGSKIGVGRINSQDEKEAENRWLCQETCKWANSTQRPNKTVIRTMKTKIIGTCRWVHVGNKKTFFNKWRSRLCKALGTDGFTTHSSRCKLFSRSCLDLALL